MCNNFDAIKKEVHRLYFLCKMQLNDKYMVYLGLCIVAMEKKLPIGSTRNEKLEAVVTEPSKNWH